MPTPHDPAASGSSPEHPDLASSIEEAVAAGDHVREAVTAAVLDAAKDARAEGRAAGERFQTILKDASDAAVRGAERAGDGGEARLREVAEGLADAFTASAQATRLAVEEAAGSGRGFATEELERTTADLRAVGSMFVDVMTNAARNAGGHLRTQADTVGEHARRAAERMKPRVEQAADAALTDPVKLAGEAAAAGAAFTREATGALVEQMGRWLDDAGRSMRDRNR